VNSDGTLTISPTTGAVIASIALGHANTWTAIQTVNSTGNPASGSNTFALQLGNSFPGIGFNEAGGAAGIWTSATATILHFGFAANSSSVISAPVKITSTTPVLQITPTGSSIDVGAEIDHSGHGTIGATNCPAALDAIYALNCIDISSDDINAPSGISNGIAALAIANKWGGSNAHGERSAVYVSTQWTANDATTSNPAGANNVGATIIAQSNINAGGGGSGSGRGGDFGLNSKCLMGSSSVNMSTCTASENDIEVQAGASLDNKVGWYVITTSGDAVQGRVNDIAAAFMVDGSVGWKCGFCASDMFTNKNPIDGASGTFLGTKFQGGPYAINIGLDLTGFSMAQQIKGTSFIVRGAGRLGAAGFDIVNSSLTTIASGQTCSGPPSPSFHVTSGIVDTC
jgi:hypothetical protein